MKDTLPELVSLRRENSPEEIYNIVFDKDQNIIESSKVDLKSFPDKIINSLKKLDKFTNAPKSDILRASQSLFEKDKLLQIWSGIDNAIKDFNSLPEVNQTIESWSPLNRKGKGEAQFHLLFCTENKSEPDFVPVVDEGYGIKYFGHDGKATVLSGEFLTKNQASNIDSPIQNILKILNIPRNEMLAAAFLFNLETLNDDIYVETLIRKITPDWAVTKLTSGISAIDIKEFSNSLKKFFDKYQYKNFDMIHHFLLNEIKNSLVEIKMHLLHEHENQKGIIGILGNKSVLINSIDQIEIRYIRTNLRISFQYKDEKGSRTSLEKVLNIYNYEK